MIRLLFILLLAFFGEGNLTAKPRPDCVVAMNKLADFEYTNGELLSALFALQSGARPETIHPKLIVELQRLGELEEAPPFSRSQLLNILSAFKKRLGSGEFSRLVGELAVPVATAAKQSISSKEAVQASNEKRDELELRDMQRGFGYRLLTDHDPAFTDPLYLARVLASVDANAPGYPESHVSEVEGMFRNAWHRLSPKTTVVDFTITGSDAVNQLPAHLLTFAREKNPEAQAVELLTFRGMWVGTKGLARELNHKSMTNLDPANDKFEDSSSGPSSTRLPIR